MRIAIGQIWQETNTFNPWPTTRTDFEQFGILRGQELVAQMADTNELGGFIQSLRAWPQQPEIVGLVRLAAWPSGTASAETFAWLRQEFAESLTQAGPVDAVLLALHGSMVSEGVPDVEGEILRTARDIIGPAIPLVATLDLHANVTESMVRWADALVLYHTVPHVDVFETGKRGATVLRRILVEKCRPRTSFQKIPMVVPAERANTQDPTSFSFHVRQKLEELEQRPGFLAAGLATVQPWLDIPNLGNAVVVVTDGNADLGRKECADLAQEVWQQREDYIPKRVPFEQAVRDAWETKEGLVVLSDAADATTSGAPGDSTWLLREILKYNWSRSALVPMVAPEVVVQAEQLGIGAEFTTMIGGKRDYRFSQPLEVKVQVVNVFDAKFVLSGHLARNLPIDMGRSAVLRQGNVFLVVTTRSGPHFAPDLFRSAGLDPFAVSVLVAKSPCGFRAAYQERARKIMVVQAPGCAPGDFSNYEFKHIPHPLWPWDEVPNWRPNPM